MGDERLRELERTTRTPTVAARLLLERLRAGRLTPSALHLAAYLGDPGARLAVEDGSAPPSDEAELPAPTHAEVADWVGGLARWGREPLLRAALAAASRTLPVYEREHPHDRRPQRCAETAASWITHRDPDHLAAARRLLESIWHRPFHRARYAYAPASLLVGLFGGDGGDIEVASEAEAHAVARDLGAVEVEARAVPRDEGWAVRLLERPGDVIRAVQSIRASAAFGIRHAAPSATRAEGAPPRWIERLLARATDPVWAEEGLSPAGARSAIRRALVPWALGDGDPLR